MKSRSNLLRVVQFTVSFGLLGLLVARLDHLTIVEVFVSANAFYLSAGVGLVLLSVAVSAWRWQLLVSTQGVRSNYKTLAYIYMVGIFFNNLLPTSIGGDVFRTSYLGRRQPHWAGIAYSVVAERVLGLVALFSIGSLAAGYLFLSGKYPEALQIAGPVVVLALIVAITSAAVILSPFPGIVRSMRRWALGRPWLQRVFKGAPYVWAASEQVGPALRPAVGLSFLFQGMAVVANYVAALTIGESLPIVLFFLFVPLVTLATLIPISVNGLGVREGLSVLLWTRVGLPEETAFSMALMAYLFVVFVGVLGGLAFAFRR